MIMRNHYRLLCQDVTGSNQTTRNELWRRSKESLFLLYIFKPQQLTTHLCNSFSMIAEEFIQNAICKKVRNKKKKK